MSKITFYPIGNADSYLVTLDSKLLLFDFANLRDAENKEDRRIELDDAVRDDIGWPERKQIDVVAFTHLDDDHIHGASEFFHLDHAAKYQTAGRVKIKELWVPAAAIVEDGAEDDARIIRQEARHRLREGYGIRVFSRPAHIKAWLEEQGIKLEDRQHLITDAGQLVPGWSKDTDGVEFFVHSPFAEPDEDAALERNDHSLVFQATFRQGDTRFLMAADTTWENWDDIVKITRLKKRDERLLWDIYKLPHHCSYLSLSSEKGKVETTPVPNVEWLLNQCRSRAILVSTSWPIDDVDEIQPPHFQAKNCYNRILRTKSGLIRVTMEYPNRVSPTRLVVSITPGGASIATTSALSGAGLISAPAPRVG
jgi:hypothetical protein